ncbi:P-loop containing nucleoside triphosphate hydrolase protein [Penicillium malachiteum]|nr:P-loop containing nucleoside triphosphate hydrolase protein [Penicillium malachiteum]
MTSRSRRAALSIVEDGDVVTVEAMDEDHAISLFEKKLGPQENIEDRIQLAAALEFIPLAIVQAAAYIKQRMPRMSVMKYLEQFQSDDCQRISLLNYKGGYIRRDREAESAILLTFFDRQGTPDYLIQQDRKAANDYSLISISADGISFEIHRLVQVAMQEWLKSHERLETWKECFIQLRGSFPYGVFENWTRCEVLFAYVLRAEAQRPFSKGPLERLVGLLYQAASFALTRGYFIDTKRMAEKAIIARRELCGIRHEKTIESASMLGSAYLLNGQLDKSEELLVTVIDISKQAQVLDSTKQVLGLEHCDTITSFINLAVAYRNQRRWKEAEELEVQVMNSSKRVLGPNHPDTLTIISNPASTYQDQGRLKEAEELAMQATDTRRQLIGPNHPETLIKAEALEVQTCNIQKRAVGLEHPNTLISTSNLASNYQAQGRYKEAEKLLIQVMGIRKKVLGPDHPDSLSSMSKLAHTMRALGQDEAALRLMAQCARMHDQKLGPDHPHTATSNATLNEWRGVHVTQLSQSL